MNDIPISYPGKYALGVAMNYADAAGAATQVSQGSPLPVTFVAGDGPATGPAALSGTAASAVTVGPFAPIAGKPVILSLSGSWSGTAQLLRSVDAGATRLPLSLGGSPWGIYTANVCEPAWDETEGGATLYLQLSPATGSVTYRLAQ